LEAYNPSTEADFNSDVRDLRGLDFPLLKELPGMTDLQPDVGQLMVLVHHKQDKVVIGSQALSVALETCHSRVRKMESNLTERLPFLKDVFVSIDHPVSAEALAILPETSTEPPVTALITTALSTVVIRPNSDPFLLVEDYENPDLAGAVRGSSFPLRSFSLYDPFPSAYVTSYGPSHLGPSFPVSSAWLASLLRYTKSPGLKLVFRILAL
ncbi:hypothetical protein Tco_0767493, partial [Tanacetum coccineum]